MRPSLILRVRNDTVLQMLLITTILMQKMQEHGFLRSRFIPVFVLKSLAKENGVQFPKCSLSIVSFW